MSNLESVTQATLVSMLRALYPDILINLSLSGISLNGTAKQNAQTINSMIAQGFERGMPDLVLYLPNGKLLNLELKKPIGGVQSPDQIKVQSKLELLGHNYHLIRDVYVVFALIADATTVEFRTNQYNQFLASGTKLPISNEQVQQLYNLLES